MKTKFLLVSLVFFGVYTNAQNTSSVRLDGVDDLIYVGTSTVFSIADSITLECWVKCDTLQFGPYNRFIDKFNFVNKTGYNLILSGGHVFFEFFSPDSVPRNLTGKVMIQDNKWHHIAVTYDMLYMRIYVDGVLDQSRVMNGRKISVSTNPLAFGSSWDGKASLPLKGNIDEIRIWHLARNATQIVAAKDSCLRGSEHGLVGYWRLNDNKDSTAVDRSTNKNNGTLRNGAIWGNDVGFNSNCPTGSAENLNLISGISIYPNPITGTSTLDLGDLPLPSDLRIFNSRGQLVFESVVNDSIILLNKSDFHKGLYFVNIVSGRNLKNLKVMVQ